MPKIDSAFMKLWAKRLFIYLIGLYFMAIGVVFSAKSMLGVSPVGSLANVIYQIGLDRNLPSYVNLGNCTTAVYCLYILTEFIILRKDFKITMLLQLVASILFGQLVNLAYAMMAFLPVPPSYPIQMLYLVASIPCVAVGVMLYLSPNILPTPGEGMSLAISKKTGLSVGSSKTVFDCSLVVISCITSLIYFHALVGVREGTVICALFVGFVMKQLQKPFQAPLLRFVERETRVNRALAELAGGYQYDASGKPKIIITIGREFGAGGYEIGKLLAEKLGITFYDSQINEMASEISGIPLKKIEQLEAHMDRELVFDIRNIPYEMVNSGLTQEEQLFVAQNTAIRQIAAGDESCVIMGRCSDYILYDNPNCFRIFIHAVPRARIDRTMKKYLINEEEAKREIASTDTSRSRHYKHFTGRDYGKQEYYHLGLDTSMLGIEASVEVIMTNIRLWCAVRGSYPLSVLMPEENQAQA